MDAPSVIGTGKALTEDVLNDALQDALEFIKQRLTIGQLLLQAIYLLYRLQLVRNINLTEVYFICDHVKGASHNASLIIYYNLPKSSETCIHTFTA